MINRKYNWEYYILDITNSFGIVEYKDSIPVAIARDRWGRKHVGWERKFFYIFKIPQYSKKATAIFNYYERKYEKRHQRHMRKFLNEMGYCKFK